MSHRIFQRPLPRRTRRFVPILILILALVLCIVLGVLVVAPMARRSGSTLGATHPPTSSGAAEGLHHVFVINLENKGYDRVWGPDSGATYLSKTLRSQGVLLTQYYSIAPSSLPNYIAQISGQSPNPRTLKDCAVYHAWSGKGTVPPAQMVGTGCVYPESVPTLAGQLSAAGKTWKGYMEDMTTPCRHPVLNEADNSKKAKPGDQYATRHNPFVYFAAITGSPDCAKNVVDFGQLKTDLTSVATTPNLSYITPNLCNDGHDKPCVNGRKGGLRSADAWLEQWVPIILASPAYKADGVLIVTFDESDEKGSKDSDSEPVASLSGSVSSIPGGTSGGRVGALVVSPYIKGGTASHIVYNHYSLLGSIEDIFGLPYLGYAGAFGQNRFGVDVYNNRPSPAPMRTPPPSEPARSSPAGSPSPTAPGSGAPSPTGTARPSAPAPPPAPGAAASKVPVPTATKP